MARQHKPQRVSRVTRVAFVTVFDSPVYAELETMAARLAPVRALAWRLYGSRAALGRSHEDIRDQDWMGADGRATNLGLPARVWKATLDDALADIKANRAAAKESVMQNLFRRGLEKADLNAKCSLLRHDEWFGQPILRRLMRKRWRRGSTSVDNQIVLDCQCYSIQKCDDGTISLEITSLTPKRRIAIPLQGGAAIRGTIRIILRGANKLEIHHSVPEDQACVVRPCGLRPIAVDKGYTETFTDSDGARHGEGLGATLSAMTDVNKVRFAGRQTLAALADKHLVKGHYRKYERIVKHNLGKQKIERQKKCHRAKVCTTIFTATHAIVDKAAVLVVEDLSHPIRGYDRGKKMNRRLSGWVKGIVQEAVVSVSRRRKASVDCVNAAYTSQVLRCHPSFGRRANGKLHCSICRAVYDVDAVAAANILDRRSDLEIGRYTPYRKVRVILEERFRQTASQGASG